MFSNNRSKTWPPKSAFAAFVSFVFPLSYVSVSLFLDLWSAVAGLLRSFSRLLLEIDSSVDFGFSCVHYPLRCPLRAIFNMKRKKKKEKLVVLVIVCYNPWGVGGCAFMQGMVRIFLSTDRVLSVNATARMVKECQCIALIAPFGNFILHNTEHVTTNRILRRIDGKFVFRPIASFGKYTSRLILQYPTLYHP